MNLSDRQKQYEKVSQTYLMRKIPVIIRLDGVAFHTFTRNFDKPVDSDYQKRGYVYVPKKDPNTPITTPIFSKDPDFVNSRVYLRYE